MGEHAAGRRGWRGTAIVVAWTSFCTLVVVGSFAFLLLAGTAQDSIFGFVLGFTVAGPAMVFGALAEVTRITRGAVEDVGPVLFVLQWFSIWLWGTLSFVRKGHFPWKAMSVVVVGVGVASFGLFCLVLLVL